MQVLVVPPHNLGYDSDYSVLLCGRFRVFKKKAFEHIPNQFPPIWASRGAPKKLPRGSQKHRSTQVVPRSSQGEQEAPRNSQEHAQGTPRATHKDTKVPKAPQEYLRDCKSDPRIPKRIPRAPQEGPRPSQEHPTRLRELPKRVSGPPKICLLGCFHPILQACRAQSLWLRAGLGGTREALTILKN